MATGVSNKVKPFSPYTYWREVIAVLMLLLAIVFFRSERKELHAILPQVVSANPFWVMAGSILTIIYIYLQGGMYKKCFFAAGLFLPLNSSVILFLKRNFISIFYRLEGSVHLLILHPRSAKQGLVRRRFTRQASYLDLSGY